jgi:hypothetical protein
VEYLDYGFSFGEWHIISLVCAHRNVHRG